MPIGPATTRLPRQKGLGIPPRLVLGDCFITVHRHCANSRFIADSYRNNLYPASEKSRETFEPQGSSKRPDMFRRAFSLISVVPTEDL
ncbi:hypothetical protein SAMN04244572_01466 [Azotobacter beijerinckii]|uniref:Uncharacterized protein n=1 Tax=Azotobacter beijerinckii TaxID=170623 RepID=A0A1H6SX59_9GAMM|nr:hypothetical protein SAMN04244572_01466 [Azotobacter beijerinckii]